ncbi:uncharacterized protein LOC127736530 [Mytilus californianus]|uniref:uncharacterized protein LOC127736530 n=1 Tax=Mytilus californianus TaxID=6549 RepID=UPI0022480616|nr:uncharacterized protein LOC127736530 [Mytilus californianus]
MCIIQNIIISNARSQNSKCITEVKSRKKDLFDNILETIRQMQINVSNRQAKQTEEMKKALNIFANHGIWIDCCHSWGHGIWNNQIKITEELEKMIKKDKISILKGQISMSKKLFPVDSTQKHLLQFSSKGYNLMSLNLAKIYSISSKTSKLFRHHQHSVAKLK